MGEDRFHVIWQDGATQGCCSFSFATLPLGCVCLSLIQSSRALAHKQDSVPGGTEGLEAIRVHCSSSQSSTGFFLKGRKVH